ncbi:MAG TPA: hypothetical protein VFA00_03000 [Actinomycetota bacterium]|nr:hypothetical protein [Actinomycetota bacterium]
MGRGTPERTARRPIRRRCWLAGSDESPAKVYYAGHILMETDRRRSWTWSSPRPTGWAEREAAAQMLHRLPERKRRRTVAADKACDTAASWPDVG